MYLISIINGSMVRILIMDRLDEVVLMTNKGNGTIDFLRMLFCIIILLFHVSLDNYGRDWNPISLEVGVYCVMGPWVLIFS